MSWKAGTRSFRGLGLTCSGERLPYSIVILFFLMLFLSMRGRAVGRPKRGDAIYWLNTRNCESDVSTIHAGCPVIHGSKWGFVASNVALQLRTKLISFRFPVANLWIHERGNNFPECQEYVDAPD